MKLIATHTNPEVLPAAVSALKDLGFSNIKIDIDNAGPRAGPRIAPSVSNAKFDTIVCPGGKEGVDECFYGENQWRWVRVDDSKVDAIEYVALYETLLDGDNHNAPGGRAAVIGYAPVLEYELAESSSSDHAKAEGKYRFILGDIVTLDRPIPAGGLNLRNLRYTKLEDLLKASTLAELFKRK